MPPRSLVRAFLALYFTLGVVVLIESFETVLAARRGAFPDHDRVHALLVGSVETIAALLFLVPRTMAVGATTLLAVFALAFAVHALGGHPNLALLVYAAGVLFVRIHGVEGYRWGTIGAAS